MLEALAIQLGVRAGIWGSIYLLNRGLGSLVFRGDDTKPPRPQEFDIARTSEGTTIPIIYGTCRVDSPVLVWFGNQSTRSVGTGYAYGIDMLLVLGAPTYTFEGYGAWPRADGGSPRYRVTRFWWGDLTPDFLPNPPALAQLEHTNTALVAGSAIFGGDGAGGGLNLHIQFFDGRKDQKITAYPLPYAGPGYDATQIDFSFTRAGVDRSLVPGYRHQMLLSIDAQLDGLRAGIGESPRIPQISVEITSESGNPAWVIYDLLAAPVWRLNYGNIDLASFTAAAAVFNAEGHKYDRVLVTSMDANEVIAGILNQTDSVLFEDRATGLWTLRAVRGGYDPDATAVITVDNVIGRPKLELIGEGGAANKLIVNFTDRVNRYAPGKVEASKIANIALRDYRIAPITLDFPGICDRATATKVCARQLNVFGRALRVLSVKTNRELFAVNTSDPVKVVLPELKLNGVFFRVLDVDDGQLADGAMELSLIEDVFDNTAGALPVGPSETTDVDLFPIAERKIVESPRFFNNQLYVAGTFADPETPHMMAAWMREDDDSMLALEESKLVAWSTDVPRQAFGNNARLVADYPRTADPYDTATGLIISASDPLAANGAPALESEIAAGANLLMIDDEVIAFESIFDNGDGTFSLSRVWRGLLDTVPADHAAGAAIYAIDATNVGMKNRTAGTTVTSLRSTSSAGINVEVHGVLGEGVDALAIVGRASKRYPVADLQLSGLDAVGTLGTGGGYKAVSLLEGDFTLTAKRRDRLSTSVVRGDAASQSPEAGTTYSVWTRKVGNDWIRIASGLTTPDAANLLLGASGHGTIDVGVSTDVGTGTGVSVEWQRPTVRVVAPHWRNLLANPHFLSAAGTPSTSGWTTVGVGNFSANAASGLYRSAVPLSYAGAYVQATNPIEGSTSIIKQTVDVRGYVGARLSAMLTFYSKNTDTDDTITGRIEGLAADGTTVLCSAEATSVSGGTTTWMRTDVTCPLTAGVASIRVTFVCGTTSLVPNMKLAEPSLRIGQLDVELCGDTFDAGTISPWTNSVNSFSIATSRPYANRNGASTTYVQAGAFNNSSIYRDFTMGDGFEYGRVVVTLAQMSSVAGDTGTITVTGRLSGVDVVSAGGVGEVLSPTDAWFRRTVVLDVTTPIDTIRVTLSGSRTSGGGGLCGACFDDISVLVHKELSPSSETRSDFSAPALQKRARSWQEFHLSYPSLPVPVGLFGNGNASVSSMHNRGWAAAWSDGLTHPPGSIAAQYGGGVGSSPALRFSSAPASSAIDLQVSGGTLELGDFGSGAPFSVVVKFRTDGRPSAAFGLIGRRSATGVGWGIQVDAAGHAVAVAQGTFGAKTATSASTVNDDALHQVALTYNPGTPGRLRIYVDRRGYTEVLTSTGLGEISIGASTPLRLGRDALSSASLGGDLLEAQIFDRTLTQAQVESMFTLGADPSGSITTYVRNAPAYVDGAPDAGGATLALLSTDQVAIGYHAASLTQGLALCPAYTNKAPAFDFANTAWQHSVGATKITGIVDPTGLARGARYSLTNAAGAQLTSIPVSSVANINATFWLRTPNANHMTARLLDSDGNLKQSIMFVPGNVPTWQRFDIAFTGWDGSTPTCQIELRPGSDPIDLDVCHVVGIHQPATIQETASPTMIPMPLTAIGGVYATLATSIAGRFVADGELDVSGACLDATPVDSAVIVEAGNSSSAINRRALMPGSFSRPEMIFWDGSAATTFMFGSAGLDWRTPWRLRGRWNRAGLIDNASNYVSLDATGSVSSSAVALTSEWATDTTVVPGLALGVSAINAYHVSAYISSITARTRESAA